MQLSLKILIATALLIAGPAFPQATAPPDFHALFEEKCLRCHGHSGPFIREVATLQNDALVGSNGQPIGRFLDSHRGGLPDNIKALFIENFRNQIISGGLFQSDCLICHDQAKEFARLKLIVRDDKLYGRYTDREILPFLRTHGRLSPDEAENMAITLNNFLPGNP